MSNKYDSCKITARVLQRTESLTPHTVDNGGLFRQVATCAINSYSFVIEYELYGVLNRGVVSSTELENHEAPSVREGDEITFHFSTCNRIAHLHINYDKRNTAS
jgi:hypothetical protein